MALLWQITNFIVNLLEEHVTFGCVRWQTDSSVIGERAEKLNLEQSSQSIT